MKIRLMTIAIAAALATLAGCSGAPPTAAQKWTSGHGGVALSTFKTELSWLGNDISTLTSQVAPGTTSFDLSQGELSADRSDLPTIKRDISRARAAPPPPCPATARSDYSTALTLSGQAAQSYALELSMLPSGGGTVDFSAIYQQGVVAKRYMAAARAALSKAYDACPLLRKVPQQ